MKTSKTLLFCIAASIILLGCGPEEDETGPYPESHVLQVNCNERGCLCKVNERDCVESGWVACPIGTQVGASIQFINPIPQ